jgi:predicted metal-dependent phosphoesterase TrpH
MDRPPLARVDLHLHTEYSPDSVSRLEDVAARAVEVGLTHLAVTDHNTIDGALRMKEVSRLPVIVGEEIMSAQGEIIGLFLTHPVAPGMTAIDTARAIREQGGLVYVPHPMDPYRSGLRGHGADAISEQIDIIEVFNARCIRESSNQQAAALAARLPSVGTSAASDAHTLREIGRSYVEGPEFSDAAGLLRMLRVGKLNRRRTVPGIQLLSRLATMRNRIRRSAVH